MKRYVYNKETLNYEEMELPKWQFYGGVVLRGVAAVGIVIGFLWFYLDVLGWDLPKTALLKKKNAALQARMEVMNRNIDRCESILEGIEGRDDEVYRSVFGMDAVPQEERESGFGGKNRYEYLDSYGADESLKLTTRRLDNLLKRAYVRSLSFDEVGKVVKQAGDMPSCIPKVPPVLPSPGNYRLTSTYGYRSDPISGRPSFHSGVDLACHKGTPVYSTGDGVVEVVGYQFRGYGNEIVINHGYGYRTHYAHLKDSRVGVGTHVCRGDRIGSVGNSGKSTGSHLHYEVLFRGSPIDPMNFMDFEMPVGEYRAMVDRREAENALKPQSVASLVERRNKQQQKKDVRR